VSKYYNENWHGIRNEWVEGLKQEEFNFGESTNNRLESFFQKLKNVVTHRLNLQEFIASFLTCIKFQRDCRRHELITSLAKVRTKVFENEHQQRFFNHLTEFAFKKVMTQMELARDVTVIDEHSVQSSKGILKVTPDTCECGTFVSLSLPCRHIIAMRNFQDLRHFLPWGCGYQMDQDV
jgi:zinc finger SWIM domain-containing protein 3